MDIKVKIRMVEPLLNMLIVEHVQLQVTTNLVLPEGTARSDLARVISVGPDVKSKFEPGDGIIYAKGFGLEGHKEYAFVPEVQVLGRVPRELLGEWDVVPTVRKA